MGVRAGSPYGFKVGSPGYCGFLAAGSTIKISEIVSPPRGSLAAEACAHSSRTSTVYDSAAGGSSRSQASSRLYLGLSLAASEQRARSECVAWTRWAHWRMWTRSPRRTKCSTSPRRR
eukprot:scaffold67678_cov30-Phaeocystis_antarctica.AAC.2